MAELKMAAIIKLSQYNWVEVFLCKMEESKMAAIIKLSQNEWVKFSLCANGVNQSWQVWVTLRGKTKMAESKVADFKMAAIYQVESKWMSLSHIELV